MIISSVKKALDIIRLFNSTETRLSLSTISERMGIPKTTAHHLLATLHESGFIERVNNDQYSLGLSLLEVSQYVRVNVELRDIAAPFLRRLGDSCNESVYLAVRDKDELIYIYAIETSHRLIARSAVGVHAMLHCTANGKAILASLPDNEILALLYRTGMPGFTPNTICDKDTFMEQIQEIRASGFACDNAEHETDTYCLGIPIFDKNRESVGGCSISGTDPEILGSRKESMVRLLLQTSLEVSRCMGFVPTNVKNLFLS